MVRNMLLAAGLAALIGAGAAAAQIVPAPPPGGGTLPPAEPAQDGGIVPAKPPGPARLVGMDRGHLLSGRHLLRRTGLHQPESGPL